MKQKDVLFKAFEKKGLYRHKFSNLQTNNKSIRYKTNFEFLPIKSTKRLRRVEELNGEKVTSVVIFVAFLYRHQLRYKIFESLSQFLKIFLSIYQNHSFTYHIPPTFLYYIPMN